MGGFPILPTKDNTMSKVCKDLDKEVLRIISLLKASGDTLSQDSLLDIQNELDKDFNLVKEYCNEQYIDRVQVALLLLARYRK